MSSAFMRAAVLGAMLVCTAPLTGALQQPVSPARAIDVDALGPKVGEAVPTFTLTDQQGVPRTLASLLGRKGAILVFFRSADW